MTDLTNPYTLPADLPVPVDDGSCLHLRGVALPRVGLVATSGAVVELAGLGDVECGSESRPTRGAVLFFYPRTGIPGQPPSLGFRGEEWDSIPGARGCTPQSCGFRDLHAEFRALGIEVYGVSTSTTEHQREFKARNHVPFEFLSDAGLELVRALRLPTFEFPVESGGPSTLIQRMAWYVEQDRGGVGAARIVKVWYPVFPPDRNAAEVLAWLRTRRAIRVEPIEHANAAAKDFVRAELNRHWHSTDIWSVGKMYPADRLPGFVARVADEPVGLVTCHFDDAARSCEVITLSAADGSKGVGSALMDAAEGAARMRACDRLFLTTTNDNLHALRFYQRRGMRIAAVHRGMMDRYRAAGQPVPVVGQGGVPLRDEIELDIPLQH